MGKILRTIDAVLDHIDDYGSRFKNTQEFTGITIDLDITGLDLDEEESDIKRYYGDRYIERHDDEIFHYNQIKYSLFHKVKETAFFFNEGIDSRKLIVLSTDCISSVQYLKRGSNSGLYIHMRSSDVQELLPLDLLYLGKILRDINTQFCGDEAEYMSEILIVTIGSAHYYLEGGRV